MLPPKNLYNVLLPLVLTSSFTSLVHKMATNDRHKATQDHKRGPVNNLLDLPSEIISLILQNVEAPFLCDPVNAVANNAD